MAATTSDKHHHLRPSSLLFYREASGRRKWWVRCRRLSPPVAVGRPPRPDRDHSAPREEPVLGLFLCCGLADAATPGGEGPAPPLVGRWPPPPPTLPPNHHKLTTTATMGRMGAIRKPRRSRGLGLVQLSLPPLLPPPPGWRGGGGPTTHPSSTQAGLHCAILPSDPSSPSLCCLLSSFHLSFLPSSLPP